MNLEMRDNFYFNSNTGELKVNGTPIYLVSDIKIERKKGERFSTVTLKFDANVEVEGKLILNPYGKSEEKWKEILYPPQS